jgi:type IV pilus assembly protein PilF
LNKFNVLILTLLIISISGCQQNTRSNLPEQGRVTTDPSVTANISLGIEYMQRKEYQIALDRLIRARDMDPGYFGTYNVLGVLYQRLGDNNTADDYFKRAIKLNPADSSVFNNYGQFLCATNQYEEAQDAFNQAASNPLYQTPEMPLTNAGICASRHNQLEDAENFFRKALELNSEQPEPLFRMSEISYSNGNYLSARGYLQRYLAVASYNAKTLWLGIKIERELGDNDTAASYKLLLKNNFPDSEEVRLLERADD